MMGPSSSASRTLVAVLAWQVSPAAALQVPFGRSLLSGLAVLRGWPSSYLAWPEPDECGAERQFAAEVRVREAEARRTAAMFETFRPEAMDNRGGPYDAPLACLHLEAEFMRHADVVGERAG